MHVPYPLPPPDEAHLYDPAVPPILGFSGKYRFLSNYFPAQFWLHGTLWLTSEASFNALKTLDPTERQWVAEATTPGEAKRRGNDRTGRITLRPDWDDVARFVAMDESLYAKFTANLARTEALLSTGRALLVEGTTWHDNFWGNCVCGRSACAQPGQNHLGRALMRLRYDLAH